MVVPHLSISTFGRATSRHNYEGLNLLPLQEIQGTLLHDLPDSQTTYKKLGVRQLLVEIIYSSSYESHMALIV